MIVSGIPELFVSEFGGFYITLKIKIYLTRWGGALMIRFVAARGSTLIRIEPSTPAWLQHELIHG